MDATRERGRVEWFDRKLGYGFINYGDQDIFVHCSKLIPGEREYLEAGDIVDFEVKDVPRKGGVRKSQAFDVKIIDPVSTSKLDAQAK